MIEIQGLHKKFGDFCALQDITMSMEKGKIYGLIGQSGSGKSTLLRCINGLIPYDKGSLKVDGIEVSSLTKEKTREFRRNIGMIFQLFSLLNRLTVFENVALPMRCWKYNNKAIETRVMELLEMVHIADKKNSFPAELSGGQKQRVAIARALVLNPHILLCDEATSALDPNIAETILDLLVDINKELGITMIVVTHQLSILKASCEYVYLLEKGRLVTQGDITTLFSVPPEPLQNLMGDQNIIEAAATSVVLRLLPTQQQMKLPIISRIARELGADISILKADNEQYRHGTVSYMIVEITPELFPFVREWLNTNGVRWIMESDSNEIEAIS